MQECGKFLYHHMPTVVKITKKYSQLVYILQIICAVYLGLFSLTSLAKF